MVTTREWWRAGLRAWGISAVVPVAVLIAVAALAIGGGVGGVRSLSQLFSGPAVPSPLGAASSIDVGQQEGISVPSIPQSFLRTAGAAALSVHARPVPSGGPGTTHRSRPSHRTPAAHPSPGTSHQVTPTPTPPVSTTPPPPPPPAPSKTITDRLGDTVDKVVAPLPVIGPTATQAIDTVVTTVDKILPLPAPSVAALLGRR
jgi:hypothetical protein